MDPLVALLGGILLAGHGLVDLVAARSGRDKAAGVVAILASAPVFLTGEGWLLGVAALLIVFDRIDRRLRKRSDDEEGDLGRVFE